MGQSPDAQKGVRAPPDIPLGVEEAIEEDTGQDGADALVLATNEPHLPVRRGVTFSKLRSKSRPLLINHLPNTLFIDHRAHS